MSMRKRKPSRRTFHLERLELRALLASDTVWNNSNWDPAVGSPEAATVVRGADAYYFGGDRNIGLQLNTRRLAVTTARPDIQLPEGLTRVWGMATVGNVYEWTEDVTPEFVSRVNSILGVSEVIPVYSDLVSGTDMTVLNEVIVGFKPNENPADFFARHIEFESFHRVAGTKTQYVGVMARNAGRPAIDLSNRLNSDPSVEWVQPNFYVNFEKNFIPNDPRFNNQWHLRNTGQSGGTVDADADVDLAWNVNQGGSSSIIVSVIDDGVQSTHPDLNVWTNPGEVDGDGFDNDGNGWVDDIHGWNFVTLTNASDPVGSDAHGTAVAGVAAARGDNGLGVAGAAYNSSVISIKIFHDGGVAALDDVASALLYAAGITADGSGTWRAGDLVNNSWGGAGPFPSMNAALAIGVVNGRSGLGATYFFSSGNNGSGVLGEPSGQTAFTPGVIAVGATTNQGVRSSYSQYGAALDIVAPSNGGTLAIDTTDRTGADGYAAGDYTGTGGTGFGGTSSASPLAAGIGALALAQAETLGVTLRPADLRAMIRNSTDLIGGVTYNINTGKNLEYGFGRVNAFTLVDGVGKPEISVVSTTADLPSNSLVNLGSSLVGQFVETTLRIRNQGTTPLQLDSISVPAPFQIRNFTPAILPLGGATTFTIRFSPTAPGVFNRDAIITSNDSDESSFTLRVRGTATAPQIGGTVFEDYDGNGVYASFERGTNLDGTASVYLDIDNSGAFNGGDVPAVVSSGGAYSFNGLATGTYTVRANTPATWKRTTVDSYSVTLTNPSDFSIGRDFGFSKRDRAYDRVIEDFNGNGVLDGIDGPLQNWVVSLGTDTQTIASTTVVPIVDGGTVFSSLNVPVSGLIQDVNVNINITHTWDSDLILTLIAPDGTEVTLASAVGLDGDNFTNTTFDDSATIPIAGGAPPFTGTFIPAQALSALNGKSLAGTWQLKVDDTFLQDTGNIESWSLIIVRNIAALSDANGYALVDIPSGTNVPSQLELQAPYEYTIPVDGIYRITPIGEPIYGRVYGAKLPDLPPTDIQLSGNFVAENLASVFIGKLTSTDPNRGNTFSYSLVSGAGSTNNGMFSIQNGDELWLVTPADYEATQSLSVLVRSTDNTNLFLDKAFVITVTNVNEVPLVLWLSGNTAREDAVPGTLVGDFSTFDTDFLTDFTFTYKLAAGTGDDDNGSFSIVGRQLRVNGLLDFETKPLMYVRVRTTDAGGLWLESTFTVTITDVNEAPTVINLTNNSLPENELADYYIGTLFSNDPDQSDIGALTYSLVAGSGDTDNIMFNIVGDGLYSSVTFNYEARSQYYIRARVTDFQGLSAENTFTINITDVNEPPDRIRLSSNRILENLPAGTAIGNLSATDPDTGDSATVALVPGELDTDLFVLVGDELQSNAIFDFETKRIYQVLVEATDTIGRTYRQSVDVEVLNQNEAPTAVYLTPDTVAENLPVGTKIGTLNSIDPDRDNFFRYEFVTGTGADDNALFAISGDQFVTQRVFNFFVKNNYTVRVKTTDLGGLSAEQVLTVNISNVNDPPTDLKLSNNTVPENVAVGSPVGSLTSTDADVVDAYTYTLIPGTGDTDNPLFTIVGNQLQTNAVFNYEAKNQFSIRIQTRDAGGLTFEKPFTISVTNVNELPLSVRLSKRSISENSPMDTPLGMLTTLDTDTLTDFSFTYSLVNGTGSTDNGMFAIVGDVIVLKGSLDYEMKQSLTIRVRSTDAGGLWIESPFAIDVINVNEAATQLYLSANSLQENLPVDTVVGLFANNDPDVPDAHRYSLVPGVGSADNLFFAIVDNELRTRQPFNFEAPRSPNYLIRVRTTDRAGLFLDSTVTVNVTDVNDAPSNVDLTPSSIPENSSVGTLIGTIVGTDEDAGAVLTYSLVSGVGATDNNQFTVVGNSVFASSTFNFESKNAYAIRLQAKDQFGLTFERPVTISVTDVNETPTNVAVTPNSVLEAQPVGTVVGTLSTTDVDANDKFTYALVAGTGDTNNGLFEIVAGQIRTKAVFDYSAVQGYTIRVRTTDLGGLSFEKGLPVQIININDPPTALALSNRIVDENVPSQTVIGTFTTTDRDIMETYTYALVPGVGGGDNALWAIVGDKLVSNSPLDFEQKPTHSIRVRSTDAGGLFTENTFTINIRDINEAPTALNLTGGSLNENSPVGSTIGTLSTIDPDASDVAWTYSLVNDPMLPDNGAFSISGNRLLTATALDFETKSTYLVRVRTTDVGGLFRESFFVLSVRDLNEAPTLVGFNFSAPENTATNVAIAQVIAADQDAGDQVTYSLVAGAGSSSNGLVTIDSTTGRIFPKSTLNYEVTPVLSVRVRATDKMGLFAESAYIIAVTDLNDAPTSVGLSPGSILENSSVGSVAGGFSTVDEDAGDAFVYTLVSGTGSTDNGQFSIVGSTLVTNSVFNFEAKNSYGIRVRTTDRSGAFFERSFAVSVIDVNEAPTALNLSNRSIAENSAPNSLVGLLSTTDEDIADAFTYSFVALPGITDSSAFSISGNRLLAKQILDFEAKSSYQLRIRTTDSQGNALDRDFTIGVLNVQEAPANIQLTGSSILEGSSIGTLVGIVSGFDPDFAGLLTYSLPGGLFDNDAFYVSGTELRSNRNFDFETQSLYSILVRATDVNGDVTDNTFPVLILDANEPPTRLSLSNTQVLENATNLLIGSFSTDDPDFNEVTTYELVVGANSVDNSAFEIVNGQLFSKQSFDFETKSSYQVRIQGVDSALNQIQRAFLISVLDQNDAPTQVTLTPGTIPENAGADRVVGVLGAIDQDANDSFEYFFLPVNGMETNSSPNFRISGNQLIAKASFNFESQSVYTERITVKDKAGSSVTSTITVNVLDVNEAPSAITVSNQAVDENQPSGTLVGLFGANDVDARDNFRFSLVSGAGSFDNAKFRINGNRLETNARFNYEAQDAYSVRVRATDSGGLFVERQVIVTINNLVEPPPVARNDSFRTSYGRTIVMDVLANDYGINAVINRSTVTILTNPLQGSAVVLPDGRIQFTHDIAAPTQIVMQYAFQDDNQVTSNVGTVAITFYSAFQNQADPMDVDFDGVVTPLDALAIVNDINANHSRKLPLNVPDANPAIDVDGDGFEGPLDVLLLVNRLNNPSGPSGEGEAPVVESVAKQGAENTMAVDLFFAEAYGSDAVVGSIEARNGIRRRR
jgi:subtilisin-like proprotein convertase family protein